MWSKSAGLFLLRLALAVIFIYHGYGKLTHIDQTAGFFATLSVPAPVVMAYLIGIVELVGGIFLALGVVTCITAAVLAVDMVVALLLAHTKMPYQSAELPIALLGGLLALCGAGGGKWSLWNASCCKRCDGECGCETEEKKM